MKNKVLSMLVLLMMAATGAWAQSTYKVTMKEGTEDATNWTITPTEATTTGVAAGTAVSVKYSGSKRVKSVKAVKKAPANVLVESITLNKTATEITVGQTETLSVTEVLPANATDPTYTWKSSDETKATVDQTGKVTAKAAGTVNIYAEANDGSGVQGSCEVTVKASVPKFTVSTTKKVLFAPGNLQYQASSGTWRFAEKQWDCVGDKGNNLTLSPTSTDWVDVFGWGTWTTGGQSPLYSESTNADYTMANNDFIGGSLGGYSNWRTLTKTEWEYVLNTRTTTSGIRYAKATVNNVCGVIILPDNWNSETYALSNTNTGGAAYTSNEISEADWNSSFETNGAVFLPAAGYRQYASSPYRKFNENGYYRSSTGSPTGAADIVLFNSSKVDPSSSMARFYGYSVRLIREVE